VMNQGVISQVGSPLDVYDNPDNMFVAGFIGSPKVNFIKGIVANVAKSGVAVTMPGYNDMKISFATKSSQLKIGEAVTIGLRPQHFAETGALNFKLNVELIEHLGGESFVYAGNGAGDLITVATQKGRALKAGQKFEAKIDPGKALLFDSNGARVR
jgi:lactose/L-arabinose transport system ATP-binding protein